jgi:hypothetical protein
MIARIRSTVVGESGCGSYVGRLLGLVDQLHRVRGK